MCVRAVDAAPDTHYAALALSRLILIDRVFILTRDYPKPLTTQNHIMILKNLIFVE